MAFFCFAEATGARSGQIVANIEQAIAYFEEEFTVNFGTPVPLLLGIILILFALFLFFLEKFKPGFKRDSDVVYAFLALTVGILSLLDIGATFQHSLQSVIFTGVFIALAIEAINGRTPDNSPKPVPGRDREDDRGPRNYRAGFEENFGAMDDRASRAQMGSGRRGRDEFEGRSGGRNERDRFLEDRPRRRSKFEDEAPSSRRGRDDFGDDFGPRSIPERTSASDRPRDRKRDDRAPEGWGGGIDDVPRPRRRPMEDDRQAGSPPPRNRDRDRAPIDEPPVVEFRPVEPIPPKESWGPKE